MGEGALFLFDMEWKGSIHCGATHTSHQAYRMCPDSKHAFTSQPVNPLHNVWILMLHGNGSSMKEGVPMADLRKKINNAAERAAGETKAAAGRLTGDKKLEMKGNLQAGKAEIKSKVMDVKEDIKRSIDKKEKM